MWDGERWHVFGTGAPDAGGTWRSLHATGPALAGPWTEQDPSPLEGVSGGCVGAPGVVAEDGRLHMFAQTDFAALGSRIEHLVSDDGGARFRRQRTALRSSRLRMAEAGVYDAHPSVVAGERVLAYAAFAQVGRPDLFLARSRSATWSGPWQRRGRVLAHRQVAHHNQLDHPDYEWGLEGPQLVELPSGRVLLNAVCFLPTGGRGTRQRVFFAVADDVTGPYLSLGPVLDPADGERWESGENGHAAVVLDEGRVWLFYQGRGAGTGWRWGTAWCRVDDVETAAAAVLA